ncbi:MAG: hypothetical protein WDM87_02790 [Terracidiphilus sp.]
MQSRNARLLLAAYGVVALFLCGCNYVVLENPLPTVQDNRIVGSWATPDGKLYAVIKPGDNSAYQSLSADDITKGASGRLSIWLRQVNLADGNPVGLQRFPLQRTFGHRCAEWLLDDYAAGAIRQFLEYDTFDTTPHAAQERWWGAQRCQPGVWRIRREGRHFDN